MGESVVMHHKDGTSRRIRVGFNWFAFFIPALWSLSEGLWRHFALSQLGSLAAYFVFEIARTRGSLVFVVVAAGIYFSVMLVFGALGNRWLLAHLHAKGWAPNLALQRTASPPTELGR